MNLSGVKVHINAYQGLWGVTVGTVVTVREDESIQHVYRYEQLDGNAWISDGSNSRGPFSLSLATPMCPIHCGQEPVVCTHPGIEVSE